MKRFVRYGTRRAACGVVFGALAVIAGCRTLPDTEAGSGRTEGVELTMTVETADESIAVFRVERDGRLAFAGGRDALRGEPSWTGDLRDTEITSLLDLLQSGGWYDPDFPDRSAIEPGSAETIKYRVSLQADRRRMRFTLRGRHPAVTPVHELLHEASLRRLEPILEALPRPGDQRR